MRIGVFGGSFDPVHFGHLLLAESCRERCKLDEVWFVPAGTPPHKQDRDRAPAKQRLEMLELAIAGHSAMRVSAIEIERDGVSYTVETLEQIRAQHLDAELFLLMGSESLADLPNWREPARICELAALAVVHRAAAPPPDFDCLSAIVAPERLKKFRSHIVDMPLIELSSTDIRRRIADGDSIRFRTPRAVEKYVETHGLYVGE